MRLFSVGFRSVRYYKQDGSKIDELFNFGNGSFMEHDFASFHFSEEPCFSKDGNEDRKQLENLIKKLKCKLIKISWVKSVKNKELRFNSFFCFIN